MLIFHAGGFQIRQNGTRHVLISEEPRAYFRRATLLFRKSPALIPEEPCSYFGRALRLFPKSHALIPEEPSAYFGRALEIDSINVRAIVAERIVGAGRVLVDDIAKATRTGIGKRVVADVTQFDAFTFGHFNRTFNAYLRIEQHVVDAEARCFVMTDLVANLVGCKALHGSVVAHICVLTRRIVGRLALIEESPPVFAFPKGLIFLEMFVE